MLLLPLGDFVWVAGANADAEVLHTYGACIERKRMLDLVERSAKGDHLRQSKLLQLSPLRWPAVLVELDEKLADTLAVPYGAARISVLIVVLLLVEMTLVSRVLSATSSTTAM